VFEQELHSTDSLLLETAKDMGAKRIFVDGISLLGRLVSRKSETWYSELLHQLIESLNRENLTAMFSWRWERRQIQFPIWKRRIFWWIR
jgi:hypothetical protein